MRRARVEGGAEGGAEGAKERVETPPSRAVHSEFLAEDEVVGLGSDGIVFSGVAQRL